ncbi:ATP-binding protein [Vibrio tetraodonis]|uniref:ATP-binding protein n=1 Tax=Vibrio tetraodonis TaxID=2231647 RepID=UPI000E0A6B4D|nr:ATP-binding protein [Vibrio tetraodonis]
MSSEKRVTFEEVYESSLGLSRQAAESLNNYWLEAGISQGLATQLELCVVEMVNNAVIHAYKAQEGFKVVVKCQLVGRDLSIEVIDQGEAMSAKALASALSNDFLEADPNDENTWETSGRGFLIVSSLMDDVVMTSEAGHNKFILTKRLEESELIDGAFSS